MNAQNIHRLQDQLLKQAIARRNFVTSLKPTFTAQLVHTVKAVWQFGLDWRHPEKYMRPLWQCANKKVCAIILATAATVGAQSLTSWQQLSHPMKAPRLQQYSDSNNGGKKPQKVGTVKRSQIECTDYEIGDPEPKQLPDGSTIYTDNRGKCVAYRVVAPQPHR